MISVAIPFITALGLVSAAGALKPGDAGPVVTVKNQDGTTIDVGSLYGHRPVVMFFFPKAFTGG